jgi:hypothetical protein
MCAYGTPWRSAMPRKPVGVHNATSWPRALQHLGERNERLDIAPGTVGGKEYTHG